MVLEEIGEMWGMEGGRGRVCRGMRGVREVGEIGTSEHEKNLTFCPRFLYMV